MVRNWSPDRDIPFQLLASGRHVSIIGGAREEEDNDGKASGYRVE